MNLADRGGRLASGGIVIGGLSAADIDTVRRQFHEDVDALGLGDHLVIATDGQGDCHGVRFRLQEGIVRDWTPACDTTQLCARLGLDTVAVADDLRREILLALLSGPVGFEYPSYEEFQSAVRIRCNIVQGARRTALAFHTTEAERPAGYWTYQEDRGFTVLPGKCLTTALRKATQPEASGELYAFSCYRATEYVILLALAQELATCNPALLEQLQLQWETRAITSGQFHEVFLREYGSMNEPLPPKYYVPGDRLWFRNPDERSSDVAGYEGSWVFYLGGGLFSNFWLRDKPYTLEAKCLELFHWRHGVYEDESGELRMDEGVVAERVRASLANPQESELIIQQMLRFREPSGKYGNGGCIDTTREYPRWVCPGTTDMVLPLR
jgi:hypothetical protein